MIITAYDGRNAMIGIDALELKTLAAIMDSVGKPQIDSALKALQLDGFKDMTESEVAAFCVAFNTISRQVVKNVKIEDEEAEETFTETDDKTVEATPVKASSLVRRKKPLIN